MEEGRAHVLKELRHRALPASVKHVVDVLLELQNRAQLSVEAGSERKNFLKFVENHDEPTLGIALLLENREYVFKHGVRVRARRERDVEGVRLRVVGNRRPRAKTRDETSETFGGKEGKEALQEKRREVRHG